MQLIVLEIYDNTTQTNPCETITGNVIVICTNSLELTTCTLALGRSIVEPQSAVDHMQSININIIRLKLFLHELLVLQLFA